MRNPWKYVPRAGNGRFLREVLQKCPKTPVLLPVLAGVVLGAAVVGGVAWLLSRRR